MESTLRFELFSLSYPAVRMRCRIFLVGEGVVTVALNVDCQNEMSHISGGGGGGYDSTECYLFLCRANRQWVLQ